MPRNIFVFIDGTMCSGDTGTNVVKIQETIFECDDNKWHYAEGVAAMSSAKWLQTILPTEINNEAYAIYKTLCAMEVTGDDRLIIIGYSRGAIIARILAQMIINRDARNAILGSSERARQVLNRNTVDFLGLFDPVRGWPYPFPIKGYDGDAHLNPSIKNLYEIVSIDEGFIFFRSDSSIAFKNKRIKEFKVLKNLSNRSITKNEVVQANREMVSPPKRHFCLFPGAHSDIGGQNANIALSATSAISMISELVRAFPDLEDQLVVDQINELKSNLNNHPRVSIGESYGFFTGFLRRFLRRKRRFATNAHTTVHPLIDELLGMRGICKTLPFYRFRKYIPEEEVLSCARTQLRDI